MRTLSNTSPLLYLYRIGQLDLLPRLYETVTIPPAVRLELKEGRQRGVDVPEPADFSWLLEIPAYGLASR
jgi:predicted nucleic acid-binding protein